MQIGMLKISVDLTVLPQAFKIICKFAMKERESKEYQTYSWIFPKNKRTHTLINISKNLTKTLPRLQKLA